MKLWVMRHAFAGASLDDPAAERARHLKPEGRATAKAIAREMFDQGEIPSVIFTSPLTRTQETGDIIGKELTRLLGGGDNRIQVNTVGELAPNRPLSSSFEDIIGPKGLKRTMFVCHVDNTTPFFEELGGEWKPLVMAEVRRVRIDRDTLEWKLRWQLKPSDLGLEDHE